MVIQLTGLSGAGKSTIANQVKIILEQYAIKVEIIDGDVYRNTICKDLGFSKKDRCENIRRLGKIANEFSNKNYVTIIAAINPYNEVRNELENKYNAKTIWIKCPLEILQQRDTKGLYAKAALPHNHPQKINNLTGVNDVYENPEDADLIIDTSIDDIATSVEKLVQFINTLILFSN